jgi:arylsulfatase A-like enzyme
MKLSTGDREFENVFVYVSDALRYDAVPEAVERDHEVHRTVANGLATPECFASIITGRYPPQHGVWRFSHELDGAIPTLFDLLPNNFFSVGPGGSLKETLNVSDVPDLDVDALEEPFFVLFRDTYAHIPYGMALDEEDPEFDSSEAYWKDRKADNEQIRRDYERGARTSGERFLSFVEDLEERGLAEDTLIIFTGDHGELLGEYGLTAHGSPTCPELVYVPTVFYNDGVEASGEFLSHVDLLPTVTGILGQDLDALPGLPGHDLRTGAPSDRLVFNQVRRLHFHESSVWDGGGGYVFKEDSLFYRLRWFSRHMRGRVTAPHNRRHAPKVLRTFLQGDRKLGDPGFTRAEAEQFYESITADAVDSATQELDEETVERLEKLGYKEEI